MRSFQCLGGDAAGPHDTHLRRLARRGRASARLARRAARHAGPALLTCGAVGALALDKRQARGRWRGRGVFEDERRRGTDLLLAASVAAYAAQLLSRGALLAWGAKVNPLIAAGQVWRLATPALLHGSLLHLGVNCYSLNNLGPPAEALLGTRRFACLYAVGAVAGNVASFARNPAPGVGASGAIFGLLGCLAVYFARHRHLHGRGGEAQLQSLLRVTALNLLLGAASPGIDNWAHAGGLAGGALFGLLFGPSLQVRGGRLVDRPLLGLRR